MVSNTPAGCGFWSPDPSECLQCWETIHNDSNETQEVWWQWWLGKSFSHYMRKHPYFLYKQILQPGQKTNSSETRIPLELPHQLCVRDVKCPQWKATCTETFNASHVDENYTEFKVTDILRDGRPEPEPPHWLGEYKKVFIDEEPDWRCTNCKRRMWANREACLNCGQNRTADAPDADDIDDLLHQPFLADTLKVDKNFGKRDDIWNLRLHQRSRTVEWIDGKEPHPYDLQEDPATYARFMWNEDLDSQDERDEARRRKQEEAGSAMEGLNESLLDAEKVLDDVLESFGAEEIEAMAEINETKAFEDAVKRSADAEKAEHEKGAAKRRREDDGKEDKSIGGGSMPKASRKSADSKEAAKRAKVEASESDLDSDIEKEMTKSLKESENVSTADVMKEVNKRLEASESDLEVDTAKDQGSEPRGKHDHILDDTEPESDIEVAGAWLVEPDGRALDFLISGLLALAFVTLVMIRSSSWKPRRVRQRLRQAGQPLLQRGA